MQSKKYYLILFIFLISKVNYSQEQTLTENPILIRTEKSWGGLIHTEGFG